MSPTIASQPKKEVKQPRKEAKIPTPRSLQLEHHQVSIPSHVYNAYFSHSASTSQNSISGKSLPPELIHAITTFMGQPFSSEPGKHMQKWILYHAIPDPI